MTDKEIEEQLKELPGNDPEYAPENIQPDPDSPLRGLHICFLGSSVTDGAAALHTSFVEDLAAKDQITYVKEAVSGTTLADTGEDSYIERMLKKVSVQEQFDLIVIQLSTNDARLGAAPGVISSSADRDAYDTKTTYGAMEYLISYCKDTYHCPIMFYTNPYFANHFYTGMVNALHEMQKKWEFGIIDLWQALDPEDLSEEEYELYMADEVHPTRAGYLLWWLPVFEREIKAYLHL